MLRGAILMGIGQAAASFIPNLLPKPTLTSDNNIGVYGWSPKPTNALLQPPPGELKKRAVDTCGYVSGNGCRLYQFS
jgi:hypothetical protein